MEVVFGFCMAVLFLAALFALAVEAVRVGMALKRAEVTVKSAGDEAAKALALSQEAGKGVQALALELARLAPDRYEITTDADGRPTGIREREVPRD